jgi:hypothetical protein
LEKVKAIINTNTAIETSRRNSGQDHVFRKKEHLAECNIAVPENTLSISNDQNLFI